MSSKTTSAASLRDAIRVWQGYRTREENARGQAEIDRLRALTKTLIITCEDDETVYGDGRIDLAAVTMLLALGIIHECLNCEEGTHLPDLAERAAGDVRVFHLAGVHHQYCLDKALHEYDPVCWPAFHQPSAGTLGYDCDVCRIAAPRGEVSLAEEKEHAARDSRAEQ